jgi:hypothetical protein
VRIGHLIRTIDRTIIGVAEEHTDTPCDASGRPDDPGLEVGRNVHGLHGRIAVREIQQHQGIVAAAGPGSLLQMHDPHSIEIVLAGKPPRGGIGKPSARRIGEDDERLPPSVVRPLTVLCTTAFRISVSRLVYQVDLLLK